MVAIVVRTRGLVARFDGERVVVAAKRSVNGRAPLPLNGDSRHSAAHGALPVHVLDLAKACRHWEGQAREEYLVISLHRHDCLPCVGGGVETVRGAGRCRRKGNFRIGDEQLVVLVRSELNSGVLKKHRRARTRYSVGCEVRVEPDVRARADGRAVEVGPVASLRAALRRTGQSASGKCDRHAIVPHQGGSSRKQGGTHRAYPVPRPGFRYFAAESCICRGESDLIIEG